MLEPAANREGTEIEAAETDLLNKVAHHLFGVGVIPGHEERGLPLDGEKSEIQDIGTELNALTTFAPGARSATISLDVRPDMSPSAKG